MSPNLIPPQPSVNSMFWRFFLRPANHRPSRKDQVVAPSWSVCGLNALWPRLRASPGATGAAEGSCPEAPQHFQTPVGKSTEVSTSMPSATPLLHPNKGKEDKDTIVISVEKEKSEVLQIRRYPVYLVTCLGFKYWLCHLLSEGLYGQHAY